MKPDVHSLTPEQKRAMLARLMQQQQAVCKTSFILQAVVLDCKVNPTSVWNIRSTSRFFRKQDPEMLRSRMQRVIDRHPALRTTYHVPAEKELEFATKLLMINLDALQRHEVNLESLIEQRVHPAHQLEFKVVDASQWSQDQLREALLHDALESWDLSKLPVCRLRLYQRKSDDIMQLDLHHAAADLWSLETINAELEQPAEGPPPPSYAEFCAWERAWFALPKAEAMRQWWRQEVDGCPPVILPETFGDDLAAMVAFRVEGELFAQARQVCRTQKITMYNLILSMLQASVGQWMQMDDLGVGGVVANRPHQRFEHTVGFFSQPVLYRARLGEMENWEQLWASNRTTIAEVVDRSFFPVGPTTPLPRGDFSLMFQQYQKARWLEDHPEGEPHPFRSGGVVDSPLGPWEFLFVDPPCLPAPVLLEVTELKDALQGLFRYRTTAFSRKTARFYVRDFQDRLARALADPKAALT